MGQRGSKRTRAADEVAESLLEKLEPLGEVTSRKMFGGVGIFESGSMFALVTSHGVPHLKVNESNQAQFDKEDAKRFGKMPYYEIPGRVLANTRSLRSWAKKSIAIANSSQK